MRSGYLIAFGVFLAAQAVFSVYLGQSVRELSYSVRDLQDKSAFLSPGPGHTSSRAALTDLSKLGDGSYGEGTLNEDSPKKVIQDVVSSQSDPSIARNIGEILSAPGSMPVGFESGGVVVDTGPFLPITMPLTQGINSGGLVEERNTGEERPLPN